MFNLTGQLIFAPDRGSDFKKVGKLTTLILDLPRYKSLPHYYVRLLQQELGPWSNLAVPMFGVHVTIVRGNTDKFDPRRVQQLQGKQLTVTVDPTTLHRTPWSGSNPGFWTINVSSPEVHELRAACGVKPVYPYRPHVTVARENLGFFMHSKAPANPLAAAKAALALVPDRGGNYGLSQDLKAFIKGYGVDPLATGDRLIELVYRHISFPAKPWEHQLVNLFKDENYL